MAKSVVFIALSLFAVVVFAAVINKLNPDFMRYEVALNSITGNPCYIKDWKTGKQLPVTKELLEKADGSFHCDPSQCK